jgi:hypothetical protein
MQFLKDMGKRPRGKSLDRKNPFLHYTPDNCQWATRKFQNKNQRRDWVKERTPEEIKAIELEAKKHFGGDGYSDSGY